MAKAKKVVDTTPEQKSQEFIILPKDSMAILGWRPVKQDLTEILYSGSMDIEDGVILIFLEEGGACARHTVTKTEPSDNGRLITSEYLDTLESL